MASSDILRQAIEAARAGREAEARGLLLQVVDVDPRNEAAWVWLSGLMDSLEDRIVACENVLTINPDNQKVRLYLLELQRQQEAVRSQPSEDVEELFDQAKSHLKKRDPATALELARRLSEQNDRHEGAWLMIADLSRDIDQQIDALEKASRINPANPETKSRLAQLRHFKGHPMDLAASLEADGKFDEAIKVYVEQAGKTKNPREFDHIYAQITRIENLQTEKIQYVSPSSSVLRLTVAWLLLYLILILVQAGLNPFLHPSFPLWAGLPLVGMGSFLLALAEVRSRNVIWQKLFTEPGTVSGVARFVVGTLGWTLIILPFSLLVLDSLNRLNNFQIPPKPFF